MKFLQPADLESYCQLLQQQKKEKCTMPCVRICFGTGCLANGSQKVYEAFKKEALERGLCLQVDISVNSTGCHGFCEHGPLVSVEPGNIFYQKVRPEDVPEIVEETILKGNVVKHLLYRDPNTKKFAISDKDVPFYAHQTRIALRHSGAINPEKIDDYIAVGGYKGLAKALSITPLHIVQTIIDSGLRGRGGGGFLTGRKWQAARNAEDPLRYVVANGDEGDPGAFMDRSLMEGDPYCIIEGMTIGAFAIGAQKGFIYVRNEYPLAVKHLGMAIRDAREAGLLGKNILGSGFSFDIELYRGGGAFVCGESTALMASIEGRVGVPRVKYIRSTEKGLWDHPTVLNNVETWANVPAIIDKGVSWFRQYGTEASPGTKIFSLVGKIKNSGLVEVPMGTPLRSIIFNIGGGILKNRSLKAVQTGGPSGGCIPESLLDLPVDFDRLAGVGSMMGSGGMIVMDDHTCMVDVARYFIDFLVTESCGKCAPCREGLVEMQTILHRLTEGRGEKGDTSRLKTIAQFLPDTALCGLGKTASNPVLSTLRYFPEEYEEHENQHFCRAGVCSRMYTPSIIRSKCIGCGACQANCVASAITGKDRDIRVIHADKCITCGTCLDMCRFNAIHISPVHEECAATAKGRDKS